MKFLENTSLKPFHTFSLDVHANQIIEAHSKEDLIKIWQDQTNELKLILGEGSNVLFCENFSGTVVLNRLKGIKKSQTQTHWLLHVEAGENWHQLVVWCLKQGILGFENLALIPGVVGSAPIQNIGAYGTDFKQFCDYVDVLLLATNETVRLTATECEFGYRDSIFKKALKDKVIVLAVGFKLCKNWRPNIEYGPLSGLHNKIAALDEMSAAKMIFDRVCQIRQEKLPDPRKVGNAGSFFKNPMVEKSLADTLAKKYSDMPYYLADKNQIKLAAGWLIEQCEMKGVRLGGAGIHDKQALVLVNEGNAKAEDIVALAHLVIEKVKQRFGVTLEPEVRLWGRDKEIYWK